MPSTQNYTQKWKLVTVTSKQAGSGCNISDLYSESVWFKCQLEHKLSYKGIFFCSFPQIHQVIAEIVP